MIAVASLLLLLSVTGDESVGVGALDGLQAAVAASPDDRELRWQYAYALFQWGRLTQADAQFARSEAQEEHAYPAFMRGVIAEEQFRLGDAVTAYDRSLRLDPAYAPARDNLAALSAYAGDLRRFQAADARLTRDLLLVGTVAGLGLLALCRLGTGRRADLTSAAKL